MKKLLLSLVFITSSTVLFSQTQTSEEKMLYEQYSKWEFTEYDILETAHKVNWIPRKEGAFNGSFSKYEKALLAICTNNPNLIRSMRMDGCYYCAKNYKPLFERYNRMYNHVSLDTWNRYCSVLFILMKHDEIEK